MKKQSTKNFIRKPNVPSTDVQQFASKQAKEPSKQEIKAETRSVSFEHRKTSPLPKVKTNSGSHASLQSQAFPLKISALEVSALSPLTPKEKVVLDFIETYILKSGFSPTYQEIKDFLGLASFNSVQNYLKQLVEKGYVENPPHQKRAIQVLHNSRTIQENMKALSGQDFKNEFTQPPRDQLLQAHGEVYSLPLLGRVAAGIPIERMEVNEYLSVPSSMVKKPVQTFLLRVEGESMIEDGIIDGDILLVESAQSFENGTIVVASVENESTVKRIFRNQKNENSIEVDDTSFRAEELIELRPSNSKMKSMWYSPEQVEVRGKVIGLMRTHLQ